MMTEFVSLSGVTAIFVSVPGWAGDCCFMSPSRTLATEVESAFSR